MRSLQDMHKPEFLQEMHKILLNFKIQADHLIPTRRPDQIMIMDKKKKKNRIYHSVDLFVVQSENKLKIKESGK